MAGAGQGASGIANLFQNLLKKIDRNGDFSVKIIFSSVSMSTLTDWSVEKYVNTNEPNTSTYPVTNLAWSQPEGDAYTTACDETIFVDCSSNEAAYFTDSDGGESTLRSYISYAIARLADIIYRKTEDGLNGTVHCILLAYHPCQKCLFALSELMGNSLAYSGIYSSFVGDILSRDEFHFTFRWIQSLCWRFQVDYCGVFDPYKAEGTDKKGDAQRAKEMDAILHLFPAEKEPIFMGDKYEAQLYRNQKEQIGQMWVNQDPANRKIVNGKATVTYEGREWTESELREEHRKITNPSVEEMEKNLEGMKAAQADRENKANRRKNTIEKARQDYAENMARRSDIEEQEINYLLAHSDTYSGYGSAQDLARARAREALKFQGIIPDSMINIPIDGHYTTDIELTAEVNRIDYDVAKGKQQIAEYEQAIANKKLAIKSQKLLACQILIAIASFPFPALGIVDIILTVYQWDISKASAVDNVMNTAGIAFDIAGLIPYFGTVFKTIEISAKAADVSISSGELFEKLAQNAKRAKGVPEIKGPRFSGEAIPDLNTELKIVAESQEGSKATLTAIRILTGEDSIGYALGKILNPHYISAFKNMSSLTDFGGFLADVWVRAMGVGYNGYVWISNANANNTPITAEEAKQREEKAKAYAELENAQKAQHEAKIALKEAKTDAARAAAQKALDDAQKRIDDASGVLGVDLKSNQNITQIPLKPASIDANAELNKAMEDERNAKRALRTKDPVAKAAAQEALNNAQERKAAAQKAVDAQKAAQTAGSPTAPQLIDEWEKTTIQLNNLENQHLRQQRALLDNQRQIAGNDALNLGASPLEAMYNAENNRRLNNQYNAANLANTLGTTNTLGITGSDYEYEAQFAKYYDKQTEAYNKAKEAGKKDRDQHMKGVEADMAAQDLRYTIEKQKKRQQQEESKNNKQ